MVGSSHPKSSASKMAREDSQGNGHSRYYQNCGQARNDTTALIGVEVEVRIIDRDVPNHGDITDWES